MYIKKGYKKILVNTCGYIRTMHINGSNCYHVSLLHTFKDFDTEDDAYRAFDGNCRKCIVCFGKENNL